MPLRKRSAYEEFEEVALPHLDELYRSASGILTDKSRAEDVVQETYLRAWRSFRRFRPGTNCRAWLFKILMNCIRDDWKKFSGRFHAGESEDILERQAAVPPVPETITDPQILEALRQLSPKLREVTVLADIEEFTYREISMLLDVPIGTVMSRLGRGRALLRQSLKGLGAPHRSAPMLKKGQGS